MALMTIGLNRVSSTVLFLIDSFWIDFHVSHFLHERYNKGLVDTVKPEAVFLVVCDPPMNEL